VATILLTSLYGADTQEDRDRKVSVRKAVDSFGKVEQKDVPAVNKFKKMFVDGELTGQLRTIYAGYRQDLSSVDNSYATAVGGMLKYELASYNGFNAAVAFETSHDINILTGDNDKQNPELSSYDGDYTQMSEAYINYTYKGLNLRAGRQLLDTPLADSDDVRMIPNSFEAYMATYELDDFTFTLGNIQRWQGVDAGLGFDDNGDEYDNDWRDLGDGGIWLGGVEYDDEKYAFSGWYYDSPKKDDETRIIYLDAGLNYEFKKDITFHTAIQYLNENEDKGSGIEADIYGAMAELVVYGLGINIAYNESDGEKGKRSYSGVGGGTMFTSMDTMIIDEITEDRDAKAIVGGLVYDIGDLSLLYAYGDFKGDSNSAGVKAHIVEQDIGFEYSVTDAFSVAGIYVIEQDRQSSSKTENDWDRFQLMAKFDF
jgi:hypothetical protein